MNIYCEVCDCHIKKSNWGKHLKTTKHGIACGEIVVEEVEKKQCWKCRGHKGLEMFRGENATCSGCLARREKWAGNNAEKVRELWQKYHAEHREEINEKKKVCNQLEVHCAVCGCRVRNNITHGFKSIARLNAGQNGPTNCILWCNQLQASTVDAHQREQMEFAFCRLPCNYRKIINSRLGTCRVSTARKLRRCERLLTSKNN